MCDLVGAENGDIKMAAAHHGEAVGMVKEGSAGFERYRLFADVDQVPVFAASFRRGAEAEYAVLSVYAPLPIIIPALILNTLV